MMSFSLSFLRPLSGAESTYESQTFKQLKGFGTSEKTHALFFNRIILITYFFNFDTVVVLHRLHNASTNRY